MTVYIVVFDKASYKIDEELFKDVNEYIDGNYVGKNENLVDSRNDLIPPTNTTALNSCGFSTGKKEKNSSNKTPLSVENAFSSVLFKLINEKEISDEECYKKANIGKQTWSKIINDNEYMPTKNVAIAFAIALKLTFEETQRFLAIFGFTLCRNSKFDIIIEYFLLKGEYDIFLINETLFKFDQVCLGT